LLLALGYRQGVSGVAWATAIAMASSGLLSLWLVNRYLAIHHRRFLATIRSPLIAATVMGVAVTLLTNVAPASLFSLLALVGVGVVLYILILSVVAYRAVRRDVNDIMILLRRRGATVVPAVGDRLPGGSGE
jgi:O-antigen/teichoic acid export membrane protein